VYTPYLWPVSPISPMQCFYGPLNGCIVRDIHHYMLSRMLLAL